MMTVPSASGNMARTTELLTVETDGSYSARETVSTFNLSTAPAGSTDPEELDLDGSGLADELVEGGFAIKSFRRLPDHSSRAGCRLDRRRTRILGEHGRSSGVELHAGEPEG